MYFIVFVLGIIVGAGVVTAYVLHQLRDRSWDL
jgi:hypothetical protein